MRRTVVSGVDIDPYLSALRTELEVPSGFPSLVEAEASKAATAWPRDNRIDATDLALVTLDPPGSRDLDQAFLLERTTSGVRLHYAIADVAAFVVPDGLVNAEAHRRGETLYLPDGRVPLHPPVLSEGAASLLPGQDRPAVLWQIDLDSEGEPAAIEVRRAVVRSTAQLDYATLQRDGGPLFALLEEFGGLRQERERARGAVSLPVPEQQVDGNGTNWTLTYRAPLAIEDWNAQMSLLTGMAAARLMLDAGIGLLRTMPPPDPGTVASLRRSALALGVDWPADESYAEVVRGLDATTPAHAALLRLAAVLFRGASYVAFDGTAPAITTHSAVAAPYAHATAPLRRLADRYVSECCLAIHAGTEVPTWVRDALAQLPAEMATADRVAHDVDRAVVDLAEALLLQGRSGEVLRGVVVEPGPKGEVQLREPAVRARLDGEDLPLGEEIDVRLESVDISRRRVVFARA
ncbi:MAG TPA: RNB domain-containing ribonuclease [Mycobacteriales bacterium]|jgi:exoribonuclease R|nr:RNB domain-containing ribonuclease [Mycobacteriales bacterium]